MNTTAIANEFSRILNKWLTSEQLSEINRRNKTEDYTKDNLCATYDFCDPNEAMGEAFFNVTGIKLEDVEAGEFWDNYMQA